MTLDHQDVQPIDVTYPDSQQDIYEYDPVGNRKSLNGANYTYDDADEILTVGGVTYAYGSNGNQARRGGDPEIGRFLGQDPIPAGNLYAYVGNNPVNAIDPSGLHCKVLKHPHHCAVDYVTDPFNILTWIQGGSLLVGTLGCVAWATGIGDVVCAGSALVYIGATLTKYEIICQDVKAGKYSAAEGKARQIVAVFPIPKGPARWAAKHVVTQWIAKYAPVDAGRCQVTAAVASNGWTSSDSKE